MSHLLFPEISVLLLPRVHDRHLKVLPASPAFPAHPAFPDCYVLRLQPAVRCARYSGSAACSEVYSASAVCSAYPEVCSESAVCSG